MATNGEARRDVHVSLPAAGASQGMITYGFTEVSGFQGISLRAGHCLQEASCRAEARAVRGEAEQGDPACDQWLAWQSGYKSRLQYADAEYFNLSDKDTRIATAKRHQKAPTLEQINHVIKKMPVLAPSLFPVGEEVRGIVAEWVSFLRNEKLWGNDAPLFPETRVALNSDREFAALGLTQEHLSNASPIRTSFPEVLCQCRPSVFQSP